METTFLIPDFPGKDLRQTGDRSGKTGGLNGPATLTETTLATPDFPGKDRTQVGDRSRSAGGLKGPATFQHSAPSQDFGAAVEIELSSAAGQAAEARGNSAHSTAHQARAYLESFKTAAATAEGESGGVQNVPFGRIVSLIARGFDPALAFAQPAEDGADDGTVSTDVDALSAEETVETAPGEGEVLPEEASIEASDTLPVVPILGDEEALVSELLDEFTEESEDPSA